MAEEIPSSTLLMSGNTPVLKFNFTTGEYDVLDELRLPWGLKGKFREVLPFDKIQTRYDDTMRQVALQKNQQAVITWLANRTLSLSRKNAKWLYNLLRLEQLNSDIEKAKVAILCRAVSVLDNYWLKGEFDTTTWEEVNIRHVPLNEVIAQVALHGKALTMQGSLSTPELTTNGAYAKAWRRHEDGVLWLYKLGATDATESRIEVMCSGLLDKMNVAHCHYEAGEDEGKYVCMCPCMATDELSVLPGIDFYSYCTTNELDFEKEILKVDAESIYKMWIVDYLLCNRDRHAQNWGFYYNPDTMELISCHPLFDHNNAFDIEYMKERESPYQFGNGTTRDAAKYAMTKVDFHFTAPITRDDFITDRQYKEFMGRAKDLGLDYQHVEEKTDTKEDEIILD